MSLQLSAYVNFEQCKETQGEEFLGHWRALVIQDPAHAAGVLLSVPLENVGQLGPEDWKQMQGALAQMDSERVRPALLHRWAIAHKGEEFLRAWLELLQENPEHALHVLETHPDPVTEGWDPAQLTSLLESPRPRIRELGIRLFGVVKQGGFSRATLREAIREPAPRRR